MIVLGKHNLKSMFNKGKKSPLIYQIKYKSKLFSNNPIIPFPHPQSELQPQGGSLFWHPYILIYIEFSFNNKKKRDIIYPWQKPKSHKHRGLIDLLVYITISVLCGRRFRGTVLNTVLSISRCSIEYLMTVIKTILLLWNYDMSVQNVSVHVPYIN